MKVSFPIKFCHIILLLVWRVNSKVGRNNVANTDVMTKLGPIRGTEIVVNGRKVNQYLGIPFAKPPLGDLRFQVPEPVKPWNETLIAIETAPDCAQYVDYDEFPTPFYNPNSTKSEDCLYLNIWVPHSRSTKSVMLWLYGGGFKDGSISLPLYNGTVLAAKGQVIVVTTNYRVGALGLFTTGTDTAPGDIALYDMLEALKWVNQNIDSFGGDPQEVTLFGQSAGAIAIGSFCVSPLTKGLFKRVIMESGSPAYLEVEDPEANLEMSQTLAEELGCSSKAITIYNSPDDVVQCLRDIDAMDIAKAYYSLSTRTELFQFLPNYGTKILPRNVRKDILRNNTHKVDVLIGNNLDEGSFLITSANAEQFGYFGDKTSEIGISDAAVLIKNAFKGPIPAMEHILAQFLKYSNKSLTDTYNLAGNFGFICPLLFFAESYSNTGNNVYYYVFKHRPGRTRFAEWMGVTHGEEIQFVFGKPFQNPDGYSKEEIKLSERMIRIWSNFAKYGKPGIKWPLYSRSEHKFLYLDTGLITRRGVGPRLKSCNTLRPFFRFP